MKRESKLVNIEDLELSEKEYIEKYWTDNWEMYSLFDIRKDLEKSELWAILREYLTKDSQILEGGCGLGQWVSFLQKKGFQIRGVDISRRTIERLKELEPDLPVDIGDITNLLYPDNQFTYYISIGVIEHYEEGPFQALKEAHRVLSPDGKLILSVPYLSAFRWILLSLRNLKQRYILSRSMSAKRFYQYVLTRKEIVEALKKTRFRVLAIHWYDKRIAIQNKLSIINWEKSKNKDSKLSVLLDKVFDSIISLIPDLLIAPNILLVCQPIKAKQTKKNLEEMKKPYLVETR